MIDLNLIGCEIDTDFKPLEVRLICSSKSQLPNCMPGLSDMMSRTPPTPIILLLPSTDHRLTISHLTSINFCVGHHTHQEKQTLFSCRKFECALEVASQELRAEVCLVYPRNKIVFWENLSDKLKVLKRSYVNLMFDHILGH